MSLTMSTLMLTALFVASPDCQRTTLEIGDAKPALAFTELDRPQSSPSWQDFEGKFVVFDFWASWCAPCVALFPEINALQREFADRDVVFYSITYEPEAFVREFLAKHPLETRIGLDADFETFSAFGAWAIPAVYVLDPSGTVVSAQHPGDLDAGVLSRLLAGEEPGVEQSCGWEDPAGAEEYFRALRDDITSSGD